ncbi:MAG: aldehyde ferredoxin oxidoreductase family protein [Promethearchaeota archaeon]
MTTKEKILRVNLTSGKISREEVDERLSAKFLGGSGVAAAIISGEVSPETGALDPANLLVFSVGPFCGTSVPFCGRHFVTAKSPLTGILGESSAGGFFGRELKASGNDHVVFEGRSENPVYLFINDDSVELRDASGLWGKTTSETEDHIMDDLHDKKVKIASIGPAGENLVKFASILSEKDRAAGRCGLGAVMGSKNLKAIVVKGSGKASCVDQGALKIVSTKIRELVKESLYAGALGQFGTQSTLVNGPGIGDVPVRNFTLSRWKGIKKLTPDVLAARGAKKHACFNCPVACTSLLEHGGSWVRAPEYETLAMLGTNLLIDDLDAIIRWNVLVNDLGMDTISLGVTIAAFIGALEAGLLEIAPESLGYVKKVDEEKGEYFDYFGTIEPVERLITMIGSREGIGDQLAEGLKKFVELNHLPGEYANVGKGLEVPAHEPRANNMTALDYATTPRGAFHCYLPMLISSNMHFKEEVGLNKLIDRFSPEGKEDLVGAVIKIQNIGEAYSSCGGCIFGLQSLSVITPWIEALNAITGRSYDVASWVKAGEDTFNMKRKFNEGCGITKEDDTIGKRFFTAIKKGGTKKNIPPLVELLPIYYKIRGWN